MPSDLDDLIQFLDQSSISTSQGSFVSVENVRRWAAERQLKSIEEAGKPKPRTMVQAKRMAARDEDIFPSEPSTPREGGASVPASEPQATTVART